NGFEAGAVCESGRTLNPDIAIISRAYSEEEEAFLRSLGATTVIRGEREIGRGILAYLHSAEGRTGSSAKVVLPMAANILASVAQEEAEHASDAAEPSAGNVPSEPVDEVAVENGDVLVAAEAGVIG